MQSGQHKITIDTRLQRPFPYLDGEVTVLMPEVVSKHQYKRSTVELITQAINVRPGTVAGCRDVVQPQRYRLHALCD